jgi:hypothetical protein
MDAIPWIEYTSVPAAPAEPDPVTFMRAAAIAPTRVVVLDAMVVELEEIVPVLVTIVPVLVTIVPVFVAVVPVFVAVVPVFVAVVPVLVAVVPVLVRMVPVFVAVVPVLVATVVSLESTDASVVWVAMFAEFDWTCKGVALDPVCDRSTYKTPAAVPDRDLINVPSDNPTRVDVLEPFKSPELYWTPPENDNPAAGATYTGLVLECATPRTWFRLTEALGAMVTEPTDAETGNPK